MRLCISSSIRVVVSLAVAAGIAGCNSPSPNSAPSGAEPAASPQTSETATQEAAVPEVAAPQRKPPAGKGNAIGRVLFDGKGAPNIEVQLCEEIGLVNGCGGQTFAAKTDKDGFYIIDGVTPGEYSLAVRIFDTNNFIYPTSGILSAAKFKVEKDQSLAVRTVNLWKTDLQTISPKNGVAVKTGQPKFTWKAYPDAANYKVTVRARDGASTTVNLETSETSVAPAKPLLNGAYEWQVEAFNAAGVKLSETASAPQFKIVGQAASNTVEITNPPANASIGGANVTLKWKEHPQATEYRVYLKGVKDEDARLKYDTVHGTSYQLPQPLPPDTYFMGVDAFQGNDKIAGSPLQQFTVK